MNLDPRARRLLKLWAPPLLAILAMALLAQWVAWAKFLLFGHHVFWLVAFILLINPVVETFSPSSKGRKTQQSSPQSFKKNRPRAQAPKHTPKQKPAPASETLAERLARLRKQKEAVDKKIEKLATKDKERVK